MIKYKILNTWRARREILHTMAFIQLTNDQGPFAFQDSIKKTLYLLYKGKHLKREKIQL
jgi:hypothetical protein